MDDLPSRAREALDRARARKLSYAVRILRAPDGRHVAVLGEAHMKGREAAAIGRAVVASFELRGVETFQRKQLFLGRALGVLIHFPRKLLQLASLGRLQGSTITEAKQLPSGATVELERTKKVPFGLHVTSAYMTLFFTVVFLGLASPLVERISPVLATLIALANLGLQLHMLLMVPAVLLRRYAWSWVIHPSIGILTLRDRLMAEGTVAMLADYPRERCAVVVMGRAHVAGYSQRLIDMFGFTDVT